MTPELRQIDPLPRMRQHDEQCPSIRSTAQSSGCEGGNPGASGASAADQAVLAGRYPGGPKSKRSIAEREPQGAPSDEPREQGREAASARNRRAHRYTRDARHLIRYPWASVSARASGPGRRGHECGRAHHHRHRAIRADVSPSLKSGRRQSCRKRPGWIFHESQYQV